MIQISPVFGALSVNVDMIPKSLEFKPVFWISVTVQVLGLRLRDFSAAVSKKGENRKVALTNRTNSVNDTSNKD